MSQKTLSTQDYYVTPLHVTPSRHAFRAYLYRCLAASHAPDPARIFWIDKPPAPSLETPSRNGAAESKG